MDHIKKTLDDGLRRIRGKIELVKKPHVGVKEWLRDIPKTASTSFMSLTTLNDQSNCESSTTSGPSTCSNSDAVEAFQIAEMPAKPSRFLSMNVELLDIFEDDDGNRMRIVLEKGLDPNFVDLNGKPLVYRAVEERKYNILDTMLDFGFGCDVNSTCQNDVNGGWASLHLACHLGDLRAVQILLGVNREPSCRRDSCDVNAVDTDRRNPLHILCYSVTWTGNDECLKSPPSALLKHSGDVFDFNPISPLEFSTDPPKSNNEGIIHQQQRVGEGIGFLSNTTHTSNHRSQIRSPKTDHTPKSTATMQSKFNFEPEILSRSSISNEENVTCKARDHKDTRSVAHSGSRSSSRQVSAHAQIMKLLIKAGCHVNAQDHCSDTPLHICATKGNLEGVRILLKNGADIDLVDDMCETALVKAIVHHKPQIVRTLLKMEHSLSDIKRYELSELLLTLIEDLNSNPQEQNEDKVIEITKTLMKKRIFLNVADSRRRTPLHLAVLYGCQGVATTLIHQPSCDINKQDDEGFTPLFVAAWDPKKVGQGSHLTVLPELINRGADINQKDCCGVLPINAALESGHYQNACVLLASGSHVNSDRWFCASVEMLRRNSSTLPFVERFVLSMINNYHHCPVLTEVATILGKINFVEGVIKSGVDRSRINIRVLHRWVQNESQDYLVSDLMENIRMLSCMLREFPSLKDLCRLRIRSQFTRDMHKKINQLPLPEVLQLFLKMSQYCETVN